MLALVLSALLTATAPAATTPDMTGFTDWHGAIDSAAVFVHDVETAQLLAGIAFREWLGNLPAAPVGRSSYTTVSGTAGGGGLSQSQLDQLAQCESGGVNGWRTGYFGIESGNEGSKSYGEQVADVERILAQSGPHAWGVMCAPILGG